MVPKARLHPRRRAHLRQGRGRATLRLGPRACPWGSTARGVQGLALLLGCLLATEQAFSFQRAVRTRIANYDQAPVTLQAASIQLVQTYTAPGQFPMAALGGEEVKVPRRRIKYMNQLNQQLPTYLLEGELTLQNHTRKQIDALQVTLVFLNAFRERIATEQQSLTETEPIAPLKTWTIKWSRNLPHQDVYELYLVVTGVRFSDETVWTATEELILVP